MDPTTALPAQPFETSARKNLVHQAARSVKWSILYNAAPRVVTPFSTMVLAALLTPSDFGLVAISTFIIALAKIVVDLGLGKAVIQRQSRVNEAASMSLLISLFISGMLYLGLWLAAPLFSQLYDNAIVTHIIRVSAFSLPLYALMTVPRALMRREMQFKRLFWVDSLLLIIQALASVALALRGMGAWSLIWGQLIGLATCTLLAWALARWRPVLCIDLPLLRTMLTFSIWVMVMGFQNWMFLYADNAIAGVFLKTQGLGLYSLGLHIATLIPTFVVMSLSDVAYPAFCKIQDDRGEIGRNLVGLQSLASAVLFPVAFGLAAVASPVIELLYNDKWMGLGAVVGALAIVPGLAPLWSLNENAYQAIGRPDISTKLAGISLLALLPMLWFSAPYGLMVFVAARFLGGLLLPLGNIIAGAHFLGTKAWDQVKAFASPLVFSVIMYGVTSLTAARLAPFDGLTGWFKLLAVIAIGGAVYFALLWFLRRDLWNRLRESLRHVLS